MLIPLRVDGTSFGVGSQSDEIFLPNKLFMMSEKHPTTPGSKWNKKYAP